MRTPAFRVAGWACLALAGCLPPPVAPSAGPARAADDGDPWGLVPSDAETIVYADVAQLRESPWTRAATAAGQEARAARAATRGFDEIADVDALLLASTAATRGETSLLVARGRFSAERVVAAFRAAHDGAAAADHGGTLVWADEQDAIALVTPRTLIAGPPAAVRAAIDCAWGRSRPVRDGEWLGRLKGALAEGRRTTLPPAVEVAVRVTEEMRGRIRAEIEEAQAVDRIGMRVHLGEALVATVVGETPGRAQASEMAAQLGGIVRQLRGRRSLAALGFSAVLDRARVTAYGARVVAEVRLEGEDRAEIAERLAALTDALGRARAAQPVE